MRLSSDQIKKVAKLANLPVAELDIQKYGSQLSKILDYIDQLNQVEVKDVQPTYNVTQKTNITRQDQVRNYLTQNQAIRNGKTQNGLFITKGIFEQE